jgi:hypothetical protein
MMIKRGVNGRIQEFLGKNAEGKMQRTVVSQKDNSEDEVELTPQPVEEEEEQE